MVKRIYIIRHGQTDYNLKRIIQGGRVDTDLNDRGRQQADQFYQFYRNIPFDKIYTSALKRTLQTVEPFRKEGIPIESYSELNEIDWGKDEGISLDEPIGLDYYRLLEQWGLGQIDLKIEGGESPIEVSIRLKKMMDLILFRPEERCVLLCVHGRIIRILLCVLLNYPLWCMDSFIHDNLCVYELRYTGTFFSVYQFSNTEHL